MEIQETHEKLIEFINKLYLENWELPIKKKIISVKSIENEFSIDDVHHVAIIVSRILNIEGGSIGNINFYKLLESYLLDEEKQKEINKIIGNYLVNNYR